MGTLALLSKDHTRGGVSVDLSVSFTSAAPVGSSLTIIGKVLKYGRSMGFTEVKVFNEEDTLIASGRHTKAFPFKKK